MCTKLRDSIKQVIIISRQNDGYAGGSLLHQPKPLKNGNTFHLDWTLPITQS
jgi:hypothetical protein